MAKSSIPQTKGRHKCIVEKRVRTYRVRVGDLGTQVQRDKAERKADFAEMVSRMESNHREWKNPPKRQKGDIRGFSLESQSRLRVALSTAKWKGGDCRRVGLTLTLPWAASPDEWRDVWHSWVDGFRSFPDASVIWRIELTTGKAKRSGGLRRCHVHAMVWLPSDRPLRKRDAALFACLDDGNVRAHLNMMAVASSWVDNWIKRNPPLTDAQMMHATNIGSDHDKCGLFVEWLDNSTDGAIHYLCNHATKHKQEQLGWIGRQWGIINRRNFEFDQGRKLDGSAWAVASRQLRRISKKQSADPSAKWSLPYGDNKCWFGKAERVLERVVTAAANGEIGK